MPNRIVGGHSRMNIGGASKEGTKLTAPVYSKRVVGVAQPTLYSPAGKKSGSDLI